VPEKTPFEINYSKEFIVKLMFFIPLGSLTIMGLKYFGQQDLPIPLVIFF